MTNIVLNVLVLAVLGAVSFPVLRRMRAIPLVGTVVLLCVLTAVFDTLMIDADLYVFDPDKILGVYIWGAPLEDFAYAIAAAIGMPVLWVVLGRRRPAGRRVREVLAASRPFSWINTAYPFAAGYLLATGGRIDATFVVGTLFFLGPYNLLMYGINDVFDYASDLRNPRKGGIEGGLVEPARARQVHRRILWACVVTTVPFVVYLLLVGDVAANATLALVLFLVVAYSAPVLRFKERPVLDSLTSAMHFVGPLLYALVLVGADLGATDHLAGARRVRALGHGVARVRGGAGRARRPRGRHRVGGHRARARTRRSSRRPCSTCWRRPCCSSCRGPGRSRRCCRSRTRSAPRSSGPCATRTASAPTPAGGGSSGSTWSPGSW